MELEFALLFPDLHACDPGDRDSLGKALGECHSGRYSEALRTLSSWLKVRVEDHVDESTIIASKSMADNDIDDFEGFMVSKIRLITSVGDQHGLLLLTVGVASLLSFVQSSWTGPTLGYDPLKEIFFQDSHALEDVQQKFKKSAMKYLTTDGEEVYGLMSAPILLAVAIVILSDHQANLNAFQTAAYWRMRALFVLQRTLDNPSYYLKEQLKLCMSELKASFVPTLGSAVEQARAWQEFGLVHNFHGEDSLATDCFKAAQEATGFIWEITGAMGKRTRFQTFDVAQLVIVAESNSLNGSGSVPNAVTPENMALNDDTLLESINFTDKPSGKIVSRTQGSSNVLSVVDQCTLLAFCLNVKNENPADGLTSEEMVPFVTKVLETPNNWSVHTMALLLRSRLESAKSRTVERSVLQLQALVDQIPLEEPPPADRLRLIFSLLIPPKWEIEVSSELYIPSLAVQGDCPL